MGTGGAHNKGNRGRSYGLMLLLAFGAALLGVMVIHKLRERGIFNLLLQEKNQQINSLHHLLQRERDQTKELERKNAQMKAKLYSLQTHKMDLDSRLQELQSTIEAMKDEQRTMESAFEEKQNEIRRLRDREIESGKENSQLTEVLESLKQKEAEIEDLKRQIDPQEKVLSGGTDDPSKPLVNFNTTQKDENTTRGGENENDLVDVREGLNVSVVADGFQNSGMVAGQNETTGEQTQGMEILVNEGKNDGDATAGENVSRGEGKTNESPQDGGRSGVREENSAENATEATVNSSEDVGISRSEEDDRKLIDSKGLQITGDANQTQREKSAEAENVKPLEEGGMKMEMAYDARHGARFKARRKHGIRSRMEKKTWRMILKNRLIESNSNSDTNGPVRMRDSRSSRGDQNGLKSSEEEEAASLKVEMEAAGELGGQSIPIKAGKESSIVKMLENLQHKDDNARKNKSTNAYTHHQEDEPQMSAISSLTDRSIDAHNGTNNDTQHREDAVQKFKDLEIGHLQETIEKVADEDEFPGDLKAEKLEETETEADNGDFSLESSLKDEEHREETEESEF